MGAFYNRGSGALPLALPGGKSASVPGKQTIELTPEEAACESVQRAVAARRLIVLPTGAASVESAPAEAAGGFAPFVPPEAAAAPAPAVPAEPEAALAVLPRESAPSEAPAAELGERPSRVSRERTSSKQRVG